MRINRLKRVQKNLSFYCNNFGFRKPYQVLIDGTFCFVALKEKVNIQDQLKSFLGEDIKLLTTQCVVLETEKLGKNVYGAMLIVKQYPVHKCGHNKRPVTGSECLRSMIGSSNSSRYIVATHDRALQDDLRLIPGVPLIYFQSKAPTLEPPSEGSQKVASEAASASWGVTQFQEVTLSKLKEVELGIKSGTEPKLKKKKKKGPNPLSCKKKKKKKSESNPLPCKEDASGVKKKRTRKRCKIPQHVKEELMRLKSNA